MRRHHGASAEALFIAWRLVWFLRGLTCLTNPLIVLKAVIQLIDDEEVVDMSFIDFSKGFDVIYYRLLCAKLAVLRMPRLAVDRIRSYLANHAFQVRLGDLVFE